MARLDPRIQIKEMHHCKQYWLAPLRDYTYHPRDDDRGALHLDGTVPSWATPSDFAPPIGTEQEDLPEWKKLLIDLDEETRLMVEEMLA